MKTIRIHNSSETFQVGTIFCLGRNYAEHAKEMKSEIPTKPIVFLKPASSIIKDGDDILRPSISHNLHQEVEFIIAIGKSGRNILEIHAREYVLGYGIGLDMTLRDIQDDAKIKGLPWTTAKGFYTSAAVSEIIPSASMPNPNDLEIRCSVNGSMRQQTKISKMIFSVEQIISYLSSLFMLEYGDLIFTGTPEGVGEVVPNDTIEAELVDWIKIHHQIKAA